MPSAMYLAEMSVMQLAEMLAKPARILVVDDDVLLCEIVERCLRDMGCESFVVHTGHDALDVLQNERFDGVLLDIRLPDIDGDHVVKVMRERQIDIPVMVVTGYPNPEVYKLIDRFGVVAVITKPVSYADLAADLRRYFLIFKVKHRPVQTSDGTQ